MLTFETEKIAGTGPIVDKLQVGVTMALGHPHIADL
jgi:hypothetical protein